MTGYARAGGSAGGIRFAVEVKSVNARGLDVRTRLAPGYDALDVDIRRIVSKAISRGAVTLTLNVDREGVGGEVVVNEQALAAVLATMQRLSGVVDAERPSLDGILNLKGVLEQHDAPPDPDAEEAINAAILAAVEDAVAGLVTARRDEGTRLTHVLRDRIDEIAALAAAAEAHPSRAREVILERLRRQVADITTADSSIPEDRLVQEALLLATKADIREELDRLAAHVAAARALLAAGGPVGRKLDFLSQEFNREANTLCSKSNAADLTAIGLDLKAVIDQFREQVQNRVAEPGFQWRECAPRRVDGAGLALGRGQVVHLARHLRAGPEHRPLGFGDDARAAHRRNRRQALPLHRRRDLREDARRRRSARERRSAWQLLRHAAREGGGAALVRPRYPVRHRLPGHASALRKVPRGHGHRFHPAPLHPGTEGVARRRAQDSKGTIQKRLRNARLEMEHYGEYDYVVVNRDLEDSVQKSAPSAPALHRTRFAVSPPSCAACSVRSTRSSVSRDRRGAGLAQRFWKIHQAPAATGMRPTTEISTRCDVPTPLTDSEMARVNRPPASPTQKGNRAADSNSIDMP